MPEATNGQSSRDPFVSQPLPRHEGLPVLSADEVMDHLREHQPKKAIELATLQSAGNSLEEQAQVAKEEIRTRRGVVAGLATCIPIIQSRMEAVKKALEVGQLEEPMARALLTELTGLTQAISQAVKENQKAVTRQEGVYEGLERAVKVMEMRFNRTSQIAENREQAAESPKAKREASGRPLSLREQAERREAQELLQRSQAPDPSPQAPVATRTGPDLTQAATPAPPSGGLSEAKTGASDVVTTQVPVTTDRSSNELKAPFLEQPRSAGELPSSVLGESIPPGAPGGRSPSKDEDDFLMTPEEAKKGAETSLPAVKRGPGRPRKNPYPAAAPTSTGLRYRS